MAVSPLGTSSVAHMHHRHNRERFVIKDIVIEAQQLTKEVSSPEGLLTIVDEVSLQVHAGESLAIVGTSGRAVMRLGPLVASARRRPVLTTGTVPSGIDWFMWGDDRALWWARPDTQGDFSWVKT